MKAQIIDTGEVISVVKVITTTNNDTIYRNIATARITMTAIFRYSMIAALWSSLKCGYPIITILIWSGGLTTCIALLITNAMMKNSHALKNRGELTQKDG